jgi:hypothetical protein
VLPKNPHPKVFMSIYYNNKQKKVGIAKELMNITIFCKEDGDILATNCEEGMEKTFVTATSLAMFFFFKFCFISFPLILGTSFQYLN